MKKLKNLSIISLVLILCTSCVQTASSDESGVTQFNLEYTSIYLLIMGLMCNQFLVKLFWESSGLYNNEDGDANSTQINVFFGFICMSITEIITGFQGVADWRLYAISFGGFIAGVIISQITCNNLAKGFQNELSAFRQKATHTHNEVTRVGKTPEFDVDTVVQAYCSKNHPVEKLSRIIGKVALLCILVGGVGIYYCVKDLF